MTTTQLAGEAGLSGSGSCRRPRGAVSAAAVLPALFLVACGSPPSTAPKLADAPSAAVGDGLLLNAPDERVSYQEEVRPILERRCVVCHGCYDAPCQLKLTSMEGLRRGANSERVYDGSRILGKEPTRLFVDADTPAEWRKQGFHTVLAEGGNPTSDELGASPIYQMLSLKERNPQPRVGRLPESLDVSLDRKQSCPATDDFNDYAKDHALGGMPYALPNLPRREYRTLVHWIAQGSPGEDELDPSSKAEPQVRRWETFLNAHGSKQTLTSRYIYEHLFQAHIHFVGTDTREFYRLVRSKTAPGEPIDEVTTTRPFGDPEGPFYYRLRRDPSIIVAKNHNVYEWSDKRMARYRELFLEPEYEVSKLPSYEPDVASNPMLAFADLPASSRYQFLLDEAKFFMEGYIKGPVCRGEVALNVIEDQFWVFFVDPERSRLGTDDQFLRRYAENMELPAERGDHVALQTIWTDYWDGEKDYLKKRGSLFEPGRRTPLDEAIEHVWDGDGKNPGAALTIFRHTDSASIRHGLVGDYPETAWVVDYPLFERIHYLLVAGFDVWGNVGHQVNTRLYMDFLRMEGELYFLSLLPASKRRPIRDSWYEDLHKQVDTMFDQPLGWLDDDTVTGYQTGDVQRELYDALLARVAPVNRPASCLDHRSLATCDEAPSRYGDSVTDQRMRPMATLRGKHVSLLPDVSFVRVRGADAGKDLAYTLLVNKNYRNVSTMLSETEGRDRSTDHVTLIDGLEGSYPNFFFVVDRPDVDEFVAAFLALQTPEQYEQFVTRYGVRRTNPTFWEHADWFYERGLRDRPLRGGVFDLNRYADL